MTRTMRSLVAASAAGLALILTAHAGAPAASAAPEAAAPEPAAHVPLRLYVADQAAARLLVVDPVTSESSEIALPDVGSAVVLQADGTTAYVRMQRGSVAVIDTASAKTVAEWTGHGAYSTSPSALALSADGSRLAVAGGNAAGCDFDVVDTTTGETVRRFSALTSWCSPSAVAFSADAKRLFALDRSSNSLFAFDTATGALLDRIDKYADPDRMHNNPAGLALTPDGASIAVAFDMPNWRSEPSIVVLDAQTLEWRSEYVLEEQVPGTRGAGQLTVSPKTGHIISGIGGYSPVVWSVDPASERIVSGTQTSWLSGAGVASGRAGETYAGTGDGIAILDAAGGVTRTLQVPGLRPSGIALSGEVAPVASVRSTPGTTAAPVVLTADASRRAGALPIASYDWDFGDGRTVTTDVPTVEHRYAREGEYTASVTLTDISGNSTRVVYDGSRTIRNGSETARAETRVVVSSGPVDPGSASDADSDSDSAAGGAAADGTTGSGASSTGRSDSGADGTAGSAAQDGRAEGATGAARGGTPPLASTGGEASTPMLIAAACALGVVGLGCVAVAALIRSRRAR